MDNVAQFIPIETIMNLCGVSEATARRWQSGRHEIPTAARNLLRWYRYGDAAEFWGPGWKEIRILPDGIVLPCWRAPIPPGQLRAMFWNVQHNRTLTEALEQARAEAERARLEVLQAEQRAAWYRGQLAAESRLGAMFTRLATA